jgi:hypothetical protein
VVEFSRFLWHEAVLGVFVFSAFNLLCFVVGEIASWAEREEETATKLHVYTESLIFTVQQDAVMERYSELVLSNS